MIYLDNAATTKPNKSALEFASAFKEKFFNPSALYSGGIEVASFLKEARSFIAGRVCPPGYECVFTSSGTEADNMAIFSSVKRGNAVTTLAEHSAVFEPMKHLVNAGVDVRFAKTNADGSVDAEHLLSLIDEKTDLVSVVHVNNETGAVNDINAIAEKAKKINPKTVFHSDGVQAFGKLSVRLSGSVDLYSVSAHKIGALKGTGALLKSKKTVLHPLIYGGGQEGGLRSGTENVFGIAAFYSAAEEVFSSIDDNYIKTVELKRNFTSRLDGENIRLISGENASPYIVCITAFGLRGEILQHILEKRGVIVGTGSACSSKKPHSRVLKECGHTPDELDGVLRISFSPYTSEEDAITAANEINFAVKELKRIMK